MMLPVYALVRSRIQSGLERAFGLAPQDQPAIVLEVPPRRALGDLAAPVAFELARRLRKAPKVLAQELQTALGRIDGVSRIEAAANGYVNFFLDRPAFVRAQFNQAAADAAPASSDKVIVEHTAINPNKAAHIGHLRNAALGDTLVRLLRFQGHAVEVQNYIDDTGVQVADVVVGFTELERRDLAAVQALADDPTTRFDYHCWDLYAKVTEWYEGDQARLDKRAHALHAIEAGNNAEADMGAFIADRIVRCHLRTMARMNVDYDLLTWEGDILRLHFWATAFDDLKARNAVFLQTEGRLKGCWVMPIEDGRTARSGHRRRRRAAGEGDRAIERHGDLRRQGHRESVLEIRPARPRLLLPRLRPPRRAAVVGDDIRSRPGAGRAEVRTRKRGVQRHRLASVVSAAAAEASTLHDGLHGAGGPIDALLVRHGRALARDRESARLRGSRQPGKAFVEVSGRKGLGVKADDLLDRLIDTAGREVGARNPELAADDRRRVAEAIAVAAVRYFLIKFSRGKVIAFDIDEALSFEGETGPYLQYAAVRAANILAKLEEREGVTEEAVAGKLPSLSPDALTAGDEGDELWGLVLEAARLDEIADNSVRSLELAVLAKYAFSLAQAFNAFYHRQPILKEEREDVRLWRAAAVSYFRRQLTLALDLMGCKVPTRM